MKLSLYRSKCVHIHGFLEALQLLQSFLVIITIEKLKKWKKRKDWNKTPPWDRIRFENWAQKLTLPEIAPFQGQSQNVQQVWKSEWKAVKFFLACWNQQRCQKQGCYVHCCSPWLWGLIYWTDVKFLGRHSSATSTPVSSNRKQTSKALSKALANTSLPLCRGEAKELIRINAILTVCPYSSHMIYPSCILVALILMVWPSTNICDLTVCCEGIRKEKALLSVPSTLNLRLCRCSCGRRHWQQYHPLYLPPAHLLSSTYTGWESLSMFVKVPITGASCSIIVLKQQ